MRATIVSALLLIGTVACGGATEEASRPAAVDIPESTTPEAPAPPKTDAPRAPPKEPGRLEPGLDPNLPKAPVEVSCKETILQAACATSHEYLAKGLELCFETKGDLGGYAAEERCADKPGFKRARVTCCYGAVVSEEPEALPVVAPAAQSAGFGGSSSGGQCPGTSIEGSKNAVARAKMCAESGFELVQVSMGDWCDDGTVRTFGEACAALTPAGL